MHKILVLIIAFSFNNSLKGSALFSFGQFQSFAGASVQMSILDVANSISIKSQLGFQVDSFDQLEKGGWDNSGGLLLTLENRVLSLSGSSYSAILTSLQGNYAGPFDVGVTVQAADLNNDSGGLLLVFGDGSQGLAVRQYSGSTYVVVGYSIKKIYPGRPDVQFWASRDEANRFFLRYRISAEANWSDAISTTVTSNLKQIALGSTQNNSYQVHAYYKDLFASPYYPTGTWTSYPIDMTRTPTVPGYIHWRQSLPLGTRIDLQTSTSDDGLAWSNWSAPYQDYHGERISSPPGRYLKVAASLYANSDLTQSPVLNSVTIEYPEAAPLTPQLSSSSHPYGLWSRSPTAQFSWILPPESPAPEASFTYWLRHNGALTGTATLAVAEPAGQAHPLVLDLPGEGSYSLDLQVRGDEPSGYLTSSAQTWVFGYDGTPPSQCAVSSATHPELLFSNNRNPVFSLAATDAMSGLSGYAAVLDRASTGDPGAVVNSGPDLRFSALDNGTWYLHARAIDQAGNLGPVTHYGIRIDYNGDLVTLEHVKALPNPVRGDSARLVYELAAPAVEVKLEFRNSQGELLKAMDGGRNVGANEVRWDLGGLANGVYFFSVSARSADDGRRFKVTRKVAVLR